MRSTTNQKIDITVKKPVTAQAALEFIGQPKRPTGTNNTTGNVTTRIFVSHINLRVKMSRRFLVGWRRSSFSSIGANKSAGFSVSLSPPCTIEPGSRRKVYTTATRRIKTTTAPTSHTMGVGMLTGMISTGLTGRGLDGVIRSLNQGCLLAMLR